jgi:acyl phosphate:glycerol-3-phosphate acyltransferase
VFPRSRTYDLGHLAGGSCVIPVALPRERDQSTMDALLTNSLGTLAAFACGSIPFGYVLARWVRGIDIRQHGSGNIGATNVWRVMGARWGLAVFVLDFLKGAVPVWGGIWLAARSGTNVGPGGLLPVLCGLAAIMGHMYPPWLGYSGGKGVATAVGVVLMLAPQSALISAATFALVFWIGRIVSLASILAALAFALAQLAWFHPPSEWAGNWATTLFSAFVPALIIWRHRANIGRLVRGEEHRWGRKPASDSAPPPTA